MASLSADSHPPAAYKPATPPPEHGADSTARPAPNAPASPYDPAFTESVIAATGSGANPRLAEIMPALLTHLHDFAREVNLTVSDFILACNFLNACGQLSDERRNETQLLFDILGVESLADEISSNLLAGHGTGGQPGGEQHKLTPSAVLGPFYREGAPLLPNGSSIVKVPAKPTTDRWVTDSTYVSGRVLSARTGLPIPGAIVDVWHTAPNGLYEQQDSEQAEMNLRGRFLTDQEGLYSFYCLRPVGYPVPDDGPAGRLLKMLDRPSMRPAHIHFVLKKDGYRPLTTQVYDKHDEYLATDAVFAVKPELVVEFKKRQGDEKARYELQYDFTLDEDDE